MLKLIRPFTKLKSSYLLAMLSVIIATPVAAQKANFGSISLAPGFQSSAGRVTGFTGGSYSLSTISNRDRNNNPCIGFGDTNPDHIITLEKDFQRLKVQVDSGGNDTTLVIQGPNNIVTCGDDTGNSNDASVAGEKWQAGTYRVWVGAIDAGTKYKYTLSVAE